MANGLVRNRFCSGCRLSKPISEFPPLKTGWKVCLTCMPRAEAAKEMQLRQEKAVRKFMSVMYEHDIPSMRKPPKTDEMLVALMAEFGGVEAYVHELAEQMREMATIKRGHPETVRLFMNGIRLVHENNKRQDQADQNALTREQIDEQSQVAVIQFLAEAALDKAKATLLAELLKPAMDDIAALEALPPVPEPEPVEESEEGNADAA